MKNFVTDAGEDSARSTARLNIHSPLTGVNTPSPTTIVPPDGGTSSRAAARLRTRLNPRDLAVLTTLAALRLVTGRQIQRLHITDGAAGGQARRTRAVMKRLTELKLVVRLSRRVGGVHAGSSGFVYGLSGHGQAVLAQGGLLEGRRRRVWETSPNFTDHVLAITDLYVTAIEADRTGKVELLEFATEPPCWRHFPGASGQTVALKPDVYLRLGHGDLERSAFIEVDLGTESSPTLTQKCAVYIAYWRTGLEQRKHEVFPSVLWLATTAKRVAQIERVLDQLPTEAQPLFQVALLDDWLEALTLGGGDEA